MSININIAGVRTMNFVKIGAQNDAYIASFNGVGSVIDVIINGNRLILNRTVGMNAVPDRNGMSFRLFREDSTRDDPKSLRVKLIRDGEDLPPWVSEQEPLDLF